MLKCLLLFLSASFELLWVLVLASAFSLLAPWPVVSGFFGRLVVPL